MKILLPSLRDNHRYVLSQVHPVWESFDPRDVYYAMNDVARGWFGDLRTSEIQPVVIRFSPGFLIVRCIRGGEADLTAILLTIVEINGKRVKLCPVRTSGTIKGLNEFLSAHVPPVMSKNEVRVSGTLVPVLSDSLGRIDIQDDDTGPKQLRFITTHEVEGA